jgi:predicted AlkP superfamily phosphohydrolase/phosphomutase
LGPSKPTTPRLLLVGWDAADWKIIEPLMSRGEMPNVARLVREGVRGNIATLYPPLSPMLWTSIATGKRPYKHGIHGFIEPLPDGLGVRPISNLGRRTKAFWNILNQHGKRSIVVGWWPSHPAEPIRGAMVSNHFPIPTSAQPDTPMLPKTVHPERWAAALAELRVHGAEITGEMLSLFAPGWERIDQETDRSIHDLAGVVAETLSIHAAATELMANEPWDLAAIYYAGIDHFSHRFMRYHAGKAVAAGQAEPSTLSGIIANAYRYHDAMLGRLLELAGPDCAVMLLSDHGFHSDRLLPDYIPAEAAGPAVEHREFGIFCLRGPGVLRGERVYGGSVLDIAPTVLHLFGLPAGADMEGKPLINAFRDRTLPEPVPSWDEVPGDDGRHDPSLAYDGAEAAESLKQLVDLGYIAPPAEDARRTVEECVAENRYNLARSYLDGRHPDMAALLFRELAEADPEEGRFHQHLIWALTDLGDRAGALRALAQFDRAAEAAAPKAAADLDKRRAEKPDDQLTRTDAQEHHTRRHLMEKAAASSYERLFLHARLALAQPRGKRREAARAMLEEIARNAGRRRGPSLFLAEGFAALNEPARALEYIKSARHNDPDDWRALALEARIHFSAKAFQKAADRAVDSLSLVYFQPRLHLQLAGALRQLGDYGSAETECRVAMAQMPGFAAAHTELARIMRARRQLGEAALHLALGQQLRQAARQRRAADSAEAEELRASNGRMDSPAFERWDGAPPADRQTVVTVVSGLPRSGTSMMMQMLTAAGVPPYTDGVRAPDDDNPRGYYEHEQATRLQEDATWVSGARGKAVKLVAHLTPFLPPGEVYRLVMMRRDLEEVVASQRAMLERLGRRGGNIGAPALMRTYTRQLIQVQNWLRKTPGVQVLSVDYAAAVRDPKATAHRLAAFLGAPFDIAAAAQSVDPGLQRQRANTHRS